MARNANDNGELNRAAARADAMFRARNARPGAEPGGSYRQGARAGKEYGGQPTRQRARHAAADDPGFAGQPSRRGSTRPQGSGQNAGSHSLADFARQNATYIISVAAVVMVVVLMIAFLRGCAQREEAGVDAVQDEVYVSPYDWDNLDRSDGRLAYVVDGQVKSWTGIDVSESQGEIDWDAVASDGIDFAMIRLGYRGATEGDLYVDEYYWANLEGAKSAGLDCGVYFFSQATTPEEAREEAEFVLEQLAGTTLEYPVAFDSELVPSLGITRTQDLGNDEMTAIAEAFCRRISESGYHTLVYGNTYDLDRYNSDLLVSQPVWWAEYGSSEPLHDIDIVMWQYDNGGDVAGVPTAVDMNINLPAV